MSYDITGSVGYEIPSFSESMDWTYIDPTPEFPEQSEWYQPGIFDINIPIHPTYKKWLNPTLKLGDLVETYNGDMGIIIETRKPEGIALRIGEANNNTYKVLIGDEEKVYIGYSLKKVKKEFDKD